MNTLLVVPLALGVALNAYATAVLIRSSFYDARQKWYQLLVVWLLPLIGAVLVSSLARDTKSRRLGGDLRNRNGFDDGDARLDNYSSEGWNDSDGGGHSDGGGDGGGD